MFRIARASRWPFLILALFAAWASAEQVARVSGYVLLGSLAAGVWVVLGLFHFAFVARSWFLATADPGGATLIRGGVARRVRTDRVKLVWVVLAHPMIWGFMHYAIVRLAGPEATSLIVVVSKKAAEFDQFISEVRAAEEHEPT